MSPVSWFNRERDSLPMQPGTSCRNNVQYKFLYLPVLDNVRFWFKDNLLYRTYTERTLELIRPLRRRTNSILIAELRFEVVFSHSDHHSDLEQFFINSRSIMTVSFFGTMYTCTSFLVLTDLIVH